MELFIKAIGAFGESEKIPLSIQGYCGGEKVTIDPPGSNITLTYTPEQKDINPFILLKYKNFLKSSIPACPIVNYQIVSSTLGTPF